MAWQENLRWDSLSAIRILIQEKAPHMRITVAIVAFLLLGLTFCYGLDVNFGGGISYQPLLSRLIISDPGWSGVATDIFRFGAVTAYLDVSFVQMDVSLATRFSGSFEGTGSFSGSGAYTYKETYLGISALLKYPFLLGSGWVFPLAGIEQDVNLSYTDRDGNDLKSGLSEMGRNHLNRFFVKFGLGFGVPLGGSLSLSSVVVLGFKLNSGLDRTAVEYYKSTYGLSDVIARSLALEVSVFLGSRPAGLKARSRASTVTEPITRATEALTSAESRTGRTIYEYANGINDVGVAELPVGAVDALVVARPDFETTTIYYRLGNGVFKYVDGKNDATIGTVPSAATQTTVVYEGPSRRATIFYLASGAVYRYVDGTSDEKFCDLPTGATNSTLVYREDLRATTLYCQVGDSIYQRVDGISDTKAWDLPTSADHAYPVERPDITETLLYYTSGDAEYEWVDGVTDDVVAHLPAGVVDARVLYRSDLGHIRIYFQR
jgi:hypothetical protein